MERCSRDKNCLLTIVRSRGKNEMKNQNELREVNRRHFFQNCRVGVGKIALASMLASGIEVISYRDEQSSIRIQQTTTT